MEKFKIGCTYISKCHGDNELIEKWTVEKITAKTITARNIIGDVKTSKVGVFEGVEFARMEYGFSYIRANQAEVVND